MYPSFVKGFFLKLSFNLFIHFFLTQDPYWEPFFLFEHVIIIIIIYPI